MYVFLQFRIVFISKKELVCPMKHLLSFFIIRLVRSFGQLCFRIRSSGAENIPHQGGALLVANHVSYLDFVLVVCAIRRPVRFVMNADIFNKPLLKPILEALHCVPVHPRNGKNDLNAFNEAVANLVNSGELVAIFPEGTVTRTGQMLEFKKGIEHLTKLIRTVVIPIHLDGVGGSPFSFHGRKKIGLLQGKWRQLVRVRIGEPIAGEVTAFHLRQRIKALEAKNFAERISQLPNLSQQVRQRWHLHSESHLHFGQQSFSLNTISQQISAMEHTLRHVLQDQTVIAVHLPKGIDLFLIRAILLEKNITYVEIPSSFDNEQRVFVMNHAGADTLITTKDLQFTKYAPNADKIVYIDEVRKAMLQFKPVHVACKRLRAWVKTKQVLEQDKLRPVLKTYHFHQVEDIRVESISSEQLSAVVESIREISPFTNGEYILSALESSSGLSYVLEFLLPIFNPVQLQCLAHEPDWIPLIWDYQPAHIFAPTDQLPRIAEAVSKKNLPFTTTIFTANVVGEDPHLKTLMDRGISIMSCTGIPGSAVLCAVNLHNYKGLDISGRPLEQQAFCPGSSGQPMPGVHVRILRENGTEADADEEGSVMIVAPASFTGASIKTRWKGFLNRHGFLYITSQIA